MNETAYTKILKLGAAGGKFRILSPNQTRADGDVIARTKGSVEKPSTIIAILRPVKPMTADEVLSATCYLESFKVFPPNLGRQFPEDILLIIQGHLTGNKTAAILRLK
jgi:hypothetical protein